MNFALNQVVDNYECLGLIDQPKAGVTYKVRNLVTGKIQALRALPGRTSNNPETAQRLLREIRVHTRLSHPNIVEFHDAFEMDGQVVMTTEYVDGPSLAELCRGGPLSPRDAAGKLAQVLEALEEAHELGIVHRGITADNVTITAGGAVKLGGFGLAKPASDNNLTRLGTAVGDARYISPEQVMAREAIDGRADLYSAGVLLYLMLTANLPFEGANEMEVLAAQVGSEPRAPRAWNPAIPAELEAVALKALRKNREERFQSAREFRTALETAAAAMPAAAPVERRPRRMLTVPAVAGILATAAGLAAVVWAAMR
ncbi:MAG: serine/threonine protein kinase [Acidobacteria bacterium]|nr:serine/threonine protein kinase [Acidobacteriota bacterium]